MADPLAGLAELPGQVADLAAEIVQASGAISRESVDRWFPRTGDPVGESYQLGSARMRWQLVFTRKSSTTFFGFRFRHREWVPIETTLAAQVFPVDRTNPPGSIALEAETPDYLVPNPTAGEIAQFAPAGATPGNAILLRVGNGIAGFLIPQDFRKTRFKAQGVEWPREKRYALHPLLDAVDALVDWRDRGTPVNPGDATPLPPAGGVRPVREVVDALSNSYLRCQAALSQLPASAVFRRPWEVCAFEAGTTIRLRENGELALKEKDERFRLRLAARTTGRRNASLRISGASHDIAPEKLTKAMVTAIRSVPDSLRDFARALGSLEFTTAFFLDSARDTAQAILLGRDDGDTNILLILRGDLAAEQTLVLGRLVFRLHGSEDSPRPEFKGGEVLRILISEAPSTTLNQRQAEWFLGVFANLKKWQDLLV